MAKRLIYADDLMQHFVDMQHYDHCACNFINDSQEPSTEWYCVEDAVENAPTIKAIPIDWMKQHKDVIAVGAVLKMWEKEQGDCK